MAIYISTGGFSKISADISAHKLVDAGCFQIELSGGVNSLNLIKNLSKLKKNVQFQIHNYFPPAEKSFVINLATQDKEIADMTLKHIEFALKTCRKLSSDYYSFHAGFLCDVHVNELGTQIKKRKLYPRETSKELFLERVYRISKKAESMGIKLMIENNVFSAQNKIDFTDNPFLMADIDESIEIIKQTSKNVKLLIDVAHLKISSNSLNLNPVDELIKCQEYVGGYHLSENNGFSDTNESFNKNSWFWKYLKKNLDYYSIEVYNTSIDNLISLKKLTEVYV